MEWSFRVMRTSVGNSLCCCWSNGYSSVLLAYLLLLLLFFSLGGKRILSYSVNEPRLCKVLT